MRGEIEACDQKVPSQRCSDPSKPTKAQNTRGAVSAADHLDNRWERSYFTFSTDSGVMEKYYQKACENDIGDF